MQEAVVFFKLLFGAQEGYLCLSFLRNGNFSEEYFKYPEDVGAAAKLAEEKIHTHNVYFCVQILNAPKRLKANIDQCAVAWADLDTCEPSNLLVEPSIVIESSPGRWQAYWIFDELVEAHEAESLCKRIAYYHAYQGCDRSGWDLSQLLRVPYTLNFKYQESIEVKIVNITRSKYRLSDFKEYPPLVKEVAEDFPFPEADVLVSFTGEQLLERFALQLPATVDSLFKNVPKVDWSKDLWALQMHCFEAGMTREEVYIVCRDSGCNKYARDGKAPRHLWNEICRSFIRNEENKKLLSPAEIKQARLLTENERDQIRGQTSFIDRYIAWASSLGDAATQYHQAGAFVILSAVLAGSVHLPTSFGKIKPNVWFMLLADTTLTRKSTAMDIAIDLLMDVDSSPLLATDGSVEGLLGGLAARPGQPSIFLRDEFSGFLEQLVKRDYYAGMAETLTKLYDGKIQKRVLKKETIEIRDPTLILFTGGILNKVTSLLTHEMVSSGFVPRFIYVTAESNTDRIKPMGPPTTVDTSQRDTLLLELKEMWKHFHRDTYMVMTPMANGQSAMTAKTDEAWCAELSPEAWNRYNQLERDMMNAGLKHSLPDLMTPTYDRLCKSGLRVAVLLAASEQRPKPGAPVYVNSTTILRAIGFVESWRMYVEQVIKDVGSTSDERLLMRILHHIKKNPGASRSQIMQSFHLNARTASLTFETLLQRGVVHREKHGKAETFTAIGAL